MHLIYVWMACATTEAPSTGETGTPPPTDTDTTPVTTPTGPPDADLSDAEVVQAFALASAAQVYFGSYDLLNSYTDAACPVWTEDGETRTGTGGCVDAQGVEWFGTVTSTLSELTQVGTIEFTGYGYRAPVACAGGGSVTVPRVATGVGSYRPDGFDVALDTETAVLDLDACTAAPATTSLVFSGLYQLVADDAMVDGSGEYVHSAYGRADVWTLGELLDNEACIDEAASGATLLSTADHDAAIVYDGLFDCDPEGTVTWYLDGHQQGELVGISCSSTGVGSGAGALLLAVGLVAGRRRRAIDA